MSNSITIFVSGIAGVFVGMGLLWVFTTITSMIIDRFEQGKAADRSRQDKVSDKPEQGKAGDPPEKKKEEKK